MRFEMYKEIYFNFHLASNPLLLITWETWIHGILFYIKKGNTVPNMYKTYDISIFSEFSKKRKC